MSDLTRQLAVVIPEPGIIPRFVVRTLNSLHELTLLPSFGKMHAFRRMQ